MVLIDPSLLVLFCFAITCIIYGSVRSYNFHNSVGGESKETAKEVSPLKLRNVIIFVAVGSLVLILFFFFFNIIFYLLLVLVTVVSFVSLFYVASPFVDYLFEKLGWSSKSLKLPKLPEIHYSVIFICVLCLSFIVLWIVTGFWLVVDCMAWCIGVTQLSLLKLPNLKIAAALLSVFLLYDVFWVFLSPYIFGESVMVTVATQMPMSSLPMALTMPHLLDSSASSLLGLGDIVLPGLFLCFNYNFDKGLQQIVMNMNDGAVLPAYTTVTLPKVSYFLISVIGYTVGFASTLVGFALMQQGQPALLYLVPCTLIPVSVAAYFQGHLKLMWKGIPASAITRDIEEQALTSFSNDDNNVDDPAQNNNDVIVPVDTAIINITAADLVVPPKVVENNSSMV